YFEPRELLDSALAQKARFAPGTRWEYSNTNYNVAGLLIQKVTGRPVGEEITKRVNDRNGQRHTNIPTPGDKTIHQAHPEGNNHDPHRTLHHNTHMDPTMATAA
ncbi:serine hydrolase, partial [Streptomyces sp. SP17BM10]|uniref:serine hydrolase domain-containing protein n=1 Tax=Streptomyces sp. SP17BM10 TaxID=3002530 RepID=UPI002E76BF96